MQKKNNSCYEFGPFQFNAATHSLWRAGQEVPLTPKLFDTLLLLLERRGAVLEREELMHALWPDICVEEGNLTTIIYTLRKTLGDDCHGAIYIVTVPRRGYRFVAPVKESSAAGRAVQAVHSLAVLPFRPLSGDMSEACLGLGIADAVITRLSNLHFISVRPTSAVRKFCGAEPDPLAVGRELAADAVLDGSLQRAGERLRVTVQLVGAHHGAPLWAAQFDEQFTDLFTMEDAISARVAEALREQLLTPE